MTSRWTQIGSLAIAAAVSLAATTQAFAFGPCSRTFPKNVSYIPELEQCDGKAAIILSESLRNSFSVVVRACDNGDRDPCHPSVNSCGTNASSPFKVQKTIQATVNREGEIMPAKIFCLKERGDSNVYRMVRRMTIKRVNPVRNPSKDLFKICLPSRIRARNPVTIVSTGAISGVGNTGYNAACATQKYLGCDINAAVNRICPMK